MPQRTAAAPVTDPLISIQSVGADLTIRIAYHEATWSADGGDGSIVGVEVLLPMGPDVPQRVTIYADVLYLQPGATYDFPGKDLTIIARKLGMSSAKTDPAIVRVSGADGARSKIVLPPCPAREARAEDGTWNRWRDASTPGHDGHTGKRGHDGVPGAPGGDAGSVHLCMYEALGAAQAPRISLLACGGKGCDALPGIDGQDGQHGGNGITAQAGSPTIPAVPGSRGGHGGDGGRAGNGSEGGTGGNGGSITITCGAAIPATITTAVAAGAAGNNGAPGERGSLGKGGDGSPRGHDGHNGEHGTVAKIPSPAKAGAATQHASADATTLASLLSVEHLDAIIGRLQFSYLTTLTFPTLVATDVTPAAEMLDTLAWLGQVVPLATAASASPTTWSATSTLVADLALKVSARVDGYGNTFDDVPSLNLQVDEVVEAATALKATAAVYLGLLAQLEQYDANKDNVLGALQSLGKIVAADEASIDDLSSALATDLPDAITRATAAVVVAQQELSPRFDEEIEKLELGSFSVKALLGALSTVLMFAGPEFSIGSAAGLAFAAGGALSGLSAFDPSQVDTANGPVKGAYIIRQFKAFEGDAVSLAQAWTDGGGSFLQPTSNNAILVAERGKMDTFLSTLSGTDGVRDAFDNFLAKVQVQNLAVLAYNGAVAKLLTALANQTRSKRRQALLQGNLANLDAPGLAELAQLASTAFQSQLRDVLEGIYKGGRAYACLALQPSQALNNLAGAQTLADLTADEVGDAVATLVDELNAFNETLSESEQTDTTVTIVIDQATHPNVIAAFIRDRKVMIDLASVFAATIDGMDNLLDKAEVRVLGVAVSLLGAPPNIQGATITTTRGGRCGVAPLDPSKPMIWFDTHEVATSNTFDTDATATPSIVSTPDELDAQMSWGGADGTLQLSQPLSGVYATWTVASVDETPLAGVTAIQLVFHIRYRPFDVAAAHAQAQRVARVAASAATRRATRLAARAKLVSPTEVKLGGRGPFIGGTLAGGYRFVFAGSALTLGVGQRFFSSGDVFGPSPPFVQTDDLLTMLRGPFAGAAPADTPRAWANDTDALRTIGGQLAARAYGQPDTLFASEASTAGHLAVTVGTVVHDDRAEARARDPRFPLRGTFSAFPGGVRLLPASLVQSYLSASSAAAFLGDNADPMAELAKLALDGSGDPSYRYTGNALVLGNGSVVVCVAHDVATAADGSVTQLFHLQTTRWHVFDGSFAWVTHYDPRFPDRIAYAGLQAGKHPWVAAERPNVGAGPDLCKYMNLAARDFADARERGEAVVSGDRSLIRDGWMRMQGAVLAAFDWFSPVAQWLRAQLGANTCAEISVPVLEAVASSQSPAGLDEGTPQVSDDPGVFVDGRRVLSGDSPLGTPALPPGYDAVAAAVDEALASLRTAAAYDRVRDDATALANATLKDQWSALSSSELIGRLMSDPTSRLGLEAIVAKHLFDPLLPQLTDFVDSSSTDPTTRAQMLDAARAQLHERATAPLLTSDGALCSALQLVILDAQVKVLDAAEVSSSLAKATSAAANARQEIARLRAMDPSDPEEREQVAEQLAESERLLADAEVAGERYAEQGDDLAHADARRDTLRGGEQAQVDAMFGK